MIRILILLRLWDIMWISVFLRARLLEIAENAYLKSDKIKTYHIHIVIKEFFCLQLLSFLIRRNRIEPCTRLKVLCIVDHVRRRVE